MYCLCLLYCKSLWPVTDSIVLIIDKPGSTLSKSCLTILVTLDESFWIVRIGIVSIWLALTEGLRRVFRLILARWRSQPMRKRLREHQPITARLGRISLKSRLIDVFSVKAFSQVILRCSGSCVRMWVSFYAFLKFWKFFSRSKKIVVDLVKFFSRANFFNTFPFKVSFSELKSGVKKSVLYWKVTNLTSAEPFVCSSTAV